MILNHFSKSLLYRKFSLKGGVYAKNKAHAVIEYNQDYAGLLSRIMGEFKKHNVNMNYIDGKIVEQDAKGHEKARFNICYDSTNPEHIRNIKSTFEA